MEKVCRIGLDIAKMHFCVERTNQGKRYPTENRDRRRVPTSGTPTLSPYTISQMPDWVFIRTLVSVIIQQSATRERGPTMPAAPAMKA